MASPGSSVRLHDASGIRCAPSGVTRFRGETAVAGLMLLDLADNLERDGLDQHAAAIRTILLEPEGDGDAVGRRRVVTSRLANALLELVTESPTLLRFEDLHWADDVSLDVLERLAVLLRNAHGMVVANYRTDGARPGTLLGQWRARLLDQRLAEEVRLRRLNASETAAMMEALTGERAATTSAEAMLSRSDGIPLHIEELLDRAEEIEIPETVAAAITVRASVLLPTSVVCSRPPPSSVGRSTSSCWRRSRSPSPRRSTSHSVSSPIVTSSSRTRMASGSGSSTRSSATSSTVRSGRAGAASSMRRSPVPRRAGRRGTPMYPSTSNERASIATPSSTRGWRPSRPHASQRTGRRRHSSSVRSEPRPRTSPSRTAPRSLPTWRSSSPRSVTTTRRWKRSPPRSGCSGNWARRMRPLRSSHN